MNMILLDFSIKISFVVDQLRFSQNNFNHFFATGEQELAELAFQLLAALPTKAMQSWLQSKVSACCIPMFLLL